MQIVVEIPDDLLKKCGGYKDIRIHAETGKAEHITTDTNKNPYFTELRFIELPEHHGRLIDADTLDECKEVVDTITGECKYAVRMDDIRNVPTIIPATKEGEQK